MKPVCDFGQLTNTPQYQEAKKERRKRAAWC